MPNLEACRRNAKVVRPRSLEMACIGVPRLECSLSLFKPCVVHDFLIIFVPFGILASPAYPILDKQSGESGAMRNGRKCDIIADALAAENYGNLGPEIKSGRLSTG